MQNLENPVKVYVCGDYIEFSKTYTVAECKKLKAKYLCWDSESKMSIYELKKWDFSIVPDPNNFLIVLDPLSSCEAKPDTKSIWTRKRR